MCCRSFVLGDFLAKEKQVLQLGGDCSVLSIKSMEEGSPSKKHKGEIVEKPELPLEFKEKFQEMVGRLSMEKGSSSKKSKGEIVDNAELPWAIKEKIQEMGGSEVKLVIQKSLFKTDLSPNHGRFSIPVQKMEKEAKNFVREREESIMAERQQQGQNQRLAGLPVFVMDPSLKFYNMHLKKWKMEKAVVYNITNGWMDLVRSNNLRVNDTVQLWSFRLNDQQLCFAFVKL
ncbi:B3 domain-containing protein At2g31420-like [Gastrolobium bilobum]|uniref:B3 domain-containing protein At2g31420-like n=1 Tax=Gastrolobium bilobum TaxID=150636 RepID=UPI002AAF2A05|nr:B3 domain-containing protein At2g31420-like [Gastrolobium bilobum]